MHTRVQCPQSPEEGFGFPGAGVTGSCDPFDVDGEQNSAVCAEPSLQSLALFCSNKGSATQGHPGAKSPCQDFSQASLHISTHLVAAT